MKQAYIDALLSPGASAEISGDDYLHLTRSVRAKVGDELRLVDSAFAAFHGSISAINRHSVTVRAEQALPVEAASAPLTLALCAAANDAFDAGLDAAVQLGATDFIPLQSRRSRAPDESRIPRLARIAREACCQSLRLRPPKIAAARQLDDYLKEKPDGRRFIAWQDAGATLKPLSFAEPLVLVVGPEGGFEASEIELAKSQGWELLNLGPHILRVPVAVATGLGLLQHLRKP